MQNIYEKGSISISKHFIHLYGTTINLNNVDNMDTFTFGKYPLFSNIGTWFGGFIFMIIICAIWRNLELFFTLYLFTFPILVFYNIQEHKKTFMV